MCNRFTRSLPRLQRRSTSRTSTPTSCARRASTKCRGDPGIATCCFTTAASNSNGTEKDFILNRELFRRAQIIVADRNWGWRLVARKRGLRAVRVRHPLRDRVELRRHPCQQLLQERSAAGRADRSRGRRDAQTAARPARCDGERRSRGADGHGSAGQSAPLRYASGAQEMPAGRPGRRRAHPGNTWNASRIFEGSVSQGATVAL